MLTRVTRLKLQRERHMQEIKSGKISFDGTVAANLAVNELTIQINMATLVPPPGGRVKLSAYSKAQMAPPLHSRPMT